MRVRYRVDGALHEVMKPPVKMRAALTSRVKIMAQLNIAERRVPQDGRIKLKMGSKVIDFRVSTLPVLFGEKIVLRILDKGNLTLDLTKFGFEPKAEQDLMRAILNPYGMVLVTGPTGSGKTTTLYSALSRINQIVAQRLVRRICKDCKQEQKYNDEELKALGIPVAEAAKLTFYKGAGCDNCGGTGYKGRQGLYEVMAMSSALRRMVLKGGSTEELREEAVKEGMLTLRSDGMVKVKRGITTLEEIGRASCRER